MAEAQIEQANQFNLCKIISQPQNYKFLLMGKSGKEQFQLPPINNNSLLGLNKENHLSRPKLSRIINGLSSDTGRYEQKATMIEAMMSKRTYEDVRDELREKKIEQMLRETRNYLNEKEERPRGLPNHDAKFKYYDHYKKLDKIVNRKKVNDVLGLLPPIEQDPTTNVLQEVENLKVLPCCMGFVKSKGEASVISVKGQKFGDKYIKAMSAGLKQSKMVESCVFSNNRLTDQGFDEITKNVSNEIIKLDFSHNSITRINQALLNTIIEPDARLEYLNLENNLLPDKAVVSLSRGAIYSKHLKYLNLRKNLLTKNCGEALSELILRSGSLEQLYIGTNRISDEAALLIFQSLEDNRTIRVFDYSMNRLGDSKPSCAKALANVLAVNKVLVHVDFSGNNFSEQESKIIQEKLHGNKKIYGFHFSGNYGYIDSRGFLKLQKREITSLHSILDKNINSYDIVFRRDDAGAEPSKFKNVCWICQGWYEQTFRFVVPEPSADGKNFVYIHFDFEQYEPRLINIADVRVKYKAMVPPRRYKYFFTWNNIQFTDHVNFATSHKIQLENKPEQASLVTMDIPLEYKYQMNHQQVAFRVEQVLSRTGKPKKLVNNWDQIIVSVLPRQEGLTTKKEKVPWAYKDSLWSKEWKLEDDQLTRNCFERDWKCSKLTNFIKNLPEQEKVKELLYKNYKLIKQIYRYYAAWSPFNGDIWAVSNNAFTEFCHEAKIVSKDTPLKIIDLTFITTNSISGTDYKGNSLVPERGLVRFQFMESLVRLAEEKFKKNGLCDSILGSVTNLIKDHLQPFEQLDYYNSEKWRLKKYFVQENDMLLKKYRSIFTDIYKKNSRMKVKPGNKPFMCLAEFKSIIERIGLAGISVLERDIYLSFNCSMMTQIDELENERFIHMTEIQFIEAIARCAYILPNTSRTEDIFGAVTPFHAKFEWIIHELKMLCSEDVKAMFADATSLFNKSEDDQQ